MSHRPWIAAAALLCSLAASSPLRAEEDSEGVRYLIVCPAGLADAVEPLADFRREQGFEVARYLCPRLPASERREEIRREVTRRKPHFLLLVGDAEAIPPWIRDDVATDRPYGDADDDGFPEASVGRLPSGDPAVLAGMVGKIVAYESRRDGGTWRKQCALVAGEARFSPLLDSLIEDLFRGIVTRAIDPAYDVDVTYANPRSPYCYPPERFADRVVERLNEGALVFAYVGHGAPDGVDHLIVRSPGGSAAVHDVLDVDSVPRLRSGVGSPLFIAIACSTGWYDGKRPCIGEELLAAAGGPVAFFGASRESNPVPNALLASQIVAQIFRDTGPIRLGPALDRAERAMAQGPTQGTSDPIRARVLGLAALLAPDEVKEGILPRHVDMYNLFGDPALSLARPDGEIEFAGPRTASPGAELVVEGRVPTLPAREVRVTLEVARDRMAHAEPEGGESPLERYRRANDKVVLAATVVPDPQGAFRAVLVLPASLARGSYLVKAFAAGADTCATGAFRCRVSSPKTEDAAAGDEDAH